MDRFKIPTDEESTAFSESVIARATKKKTESDMNTFRSFVSAMNHPKAVDEFTPDDLKDVMMKFVIGVRKTDGAVYEPSSLQGLWYSIKRHYTKKGMDMSDSKFDCVSLQLRAACKKLKQEGGGRLPNRSNALTRDEITFLFRSKCAGPHHPVALEGALVIFAMYLGRRGREELRNLKLKDFQVVNSNGHVFLEMPELTAKNRQGDKDEHVEDVGRLAALPENWKCPVYCFTTYVSRRPLRMMSPDSPFFLACNTKAPKDLRQPFDDKTWYLSGPLGEKPLSIIVNRMVTASGLNVTGRKITNTSVRKSVVSTMFDAGMSDAAIMSYTRHKSRSSLAHYDTMNPQKATKITGLLLDSNPTYNLHPPSPVLLTEKLPKLYTDDELHATSSKRGPSPLKKDTGKRVKIKGVTYKLPVYPSKNKHATVQIHASPPKKSSPPKHAPTISFVGLNPTHVRVRKAASSNQTNNPNIFTIRNSKVPRPSSSNKAPVTTSCNNSPRIVLNFKGPCYTVPATPQFPPQSVPVISSPLTATSLIVDSQRFNTTAPQPPSPSPTSPPAKRPRTESPATNDSQPKSWPSKSPQTPFQQPRQTASQQPLPASQQQNISPLPSPYFMACTPSISTPNLDAVRPQNSSHPVQNNYYGPVTINYNGPVYNITKSYDSANE